MPRAAGQVCLLSTGLGTNGPIMPISLLPHTNLPHNMSNVQYGHEMYYGIGNDNLLQLPDHLVAGIVHICALWELYSIVSMPKVFVLIFQGVRTLLVEHQTVMPRSMPSPDSTINIMVK